MIAASLRSVALAATADSPDPIPTLDKFDAAGLMALVSGKAGACLHCLAECRTAFWVSYPEVI
jgi:hypothetical protein